MISPNRVAGIAAGVAFAISAAWVLAIPPLDAPDEPAHLLAVQQVARRNMLPRVVYRFDRDPKGEVADGPVDVATRAYLLRSGVGDEFKLLPYESMQPPLFYLVAGVLAKLLTTDPHAVLYIARFVAAAFGAGTVYVVAKAASRFSGEDPTRVLAAAGFVALLPQFAFNSATAGNDAAMSFTAALAFATWIRALSDPRFDTRLIRSGAVLGLAFWAKLSALALNPAFGIVVLARVSAARGKGLRSLVEPAIGAAIGGLLAAGPLMARNLWVYGEPTGASNALEFYRARFLPLRWESSADWSLFGVTTWESFWGRFGWMSRQLPQAFYSQAIVVTVVLLVVGYLGLIRAWDLQRGSGWSILMLAVGAAGMFASLIQFNFRVAFQSQGRYLFPALVPISLLLTFGLARGLPKGRIACGAIVLLFAWLGYWNVAGMIRVR